MLQELKNSSAKLTTQTQPLAKILGTNANAATGKDSGRQEKAQRNASESQKRRQGKSRNVSEQCYQQQRSRDPSNQKSIKHGSKANIAHYYEYRSNAISPTKAATRATLLLKNAAASSNGSQLPSGSSAQLGSSRNVKQQFQTLGVATATGLSNMSKQAQQYSSHSSFKGGAGGSLLHLKHQNLLENSLEKDSRKQLRRQALISTVAKGSSLKKADQGLKMRHGAPHAATQLNLEIAASRGSKVIK